MIEWIFARFGYVPVHRLRSAEAIIDSYAASMSRLMRRKHALQAEIGRLQANGVARDEKGRFVRR